MEKKKDKKFYGEMPHSLEAEQALLSCMLLDAEVQNDVVNKLSDEDFYTESHKIIFNAMKETLKSNVNLDIVTLADCLERSGNLDQAGGMSYLMGLLDLMPSSANYQRYQEMIERDSVLRKLIKGSAEIIENCRQSTDENDSIAYAEKVVYDISQGAETSSLTRIDSVIPKIMAKLDEISRNKKSASGIKTGFKKLDYLTNGLHKSDLVIIAARPSMGKTSFAMNIVENVAQQGYSCAVFSLEMNKEQLAQRMLCSVAGVDMGRVSKGELNKTDWIKIAKAKEILSKCNIYIDEKGAITPHEMLSKCRRLKARHGLDLIMIDYIQLMDLGEGAKAESRQQEITKISRNLKLLAKEIDVPVLALSQLSRATEKEKRPPQLSDLRDSGAIEQDADIVLFIHRPDKMSKDKDLESGKVKKNVAEIRVEKHRNGATGKFELYFESACTKFVNINSETGEIESNLESSQKLEKPIEKIEQIDEDTDFNNENEDFSNLGSSIDKDVFGE